MKPEDILTDKQIRALKKSVKLIDGKVVLTDEYIASLKHGLWLLRELDKLRMAREL